MFVFVVGRIALLGQFVHPFGADLHLHPAVFGAHHGDMQGLVTGRFRGSDPVAQAARVRVEFVRNDRIDLPGAELFLFLGAFVNDTDRKTVIHLVEAHPLVDHLFVDGVDGLVAPGDGVVQVFAVQHILDLGDKTGNVRLLRLIRLAQQPDDVLVGLRLGVFEREVLHLRFDVVQPQPVRQRSVDVECFRSDLLLFLADHRPHGLHVVQAVGQFDQDHADVVGDGDEHLAEIFRLNAHVGVRDARYFGQSVDDPGNGRAVLPFDVFQGNVRVLHHVVQQG